MVKSELVKSIGTVNVNEIRLNDLVIVNTHRKEEELRKKIKYKGITLYGQDGRIYQQEQRVFILNRNDCI